MGKRIIAILGLLLIAGIAFGSGTSSDYVQTLANNMAAAIQKALKITLTSGQVGSIVALTQAFAKYGDGDNRKLAYILAVVYYEAGLMPIKERKAAAGSVVWEQYQKNYWNTGFYGRGFVQITWEGNYRKLGKALGYGEQFVQNPDMVLDTTIAAEICVYGMMNGSFTNKSLGTYFNETQADSYNARRIVNAIIVAGVDTAKIIQGYYNGIINNLPYG